MPTETPYLDRLKRLVEESKTFSFRWKFVMKSALHLADGLTAIEDTAGDIIIFFDRKGWTPINPGAWGRSLYPDHMIPHNLGRINSDTARKKLGLDQSVLEFVKEIIKPRDDRQWHEPLQAVVTEL